ncbi:MAG: chorismate synthase, partial [Ruminiclostridium sp.]
MKEQVTVNVATLEPTVHKFASRSDPSLVPRVYSICEAMVRIALVDSIMMSAGLKSVTDIDARWNSL